MNSIDTAPLSWVIDEVRTAAGEAQEALAKYRASRNDTGSLRLAKSHVHQVHGAMQMLDIPGLSVLSEATEALLARFDQAPDTATPNALNAAEQAINALLAYSDELLAGATHQPLRLYPYLHDVLQARGAERVHPADLFFPPLGTRLGFDTPARATSQEELRSKRRDYELGLLSILNDQVSDPALLPMREALASLADVQPGPQARTFWTVAVALFDALRDRAVPVDLNVKRLVARLNLQLKRAVEGAPNIAERLLRDALYFVARADSRAPLVAQVQESFKLRGAVPEHFETHRFVRVDRDLLTSAKEKVAQLKGVWNQAAGSPDGQDGVRARPEVMQQFAADANALADLLEKLNQPHAQRLAATLARIAAERGASGDAATDALGLEVASALLFMEMLLGSIYTQDSRHVARVEAVIGRVESAATGLAPGAVEPWLNELARKEQEKSTLAQLAGELSSQLSSVEKNLDAYFRNPADRGAIAAADAPLSQVQGALGLLGFEPAQQAVAYVRDKLAEFASPEYVAKAEDFSQLAETYGRLTLAVEAFVRDPQGERERYVFDAQQGLLRERESARQTGEFSAQEFIPPQINEEAATVELQLAEQQKKTLAIFEALERSPESAELRQELSVSLGQMRDSAALVDDEHAAASSAQALQALKSSTAGANQDSASLQSLAQAMEQIVPAAPAVPDVADMPADQAGIDAELLEIFLAEAQDVLDTLHQALAHARKQPDSVETLTTIRRGFHTLKGSGRMVGLDVFGEAAWSLEQVLNHWLAEGKPATDDLLKLVDRSSSEMRQWIEEIARDGFSRRKSAPFEVAAHAVRDGHAFSWPQERASVAAMTAPAPEAVEEPAAPVVVEDVKRVGPVSIGLPLFNIYMTESDENARRLVQEFSEWQHEGDRPVSDLALRLSHTLSGSSATVGLESVHSLGHAIELVLLAGKRSNVHLTREQHAVLQEAARHFAGMLSTAAAGDYPEAPTGLIEQLATLRIQIEEGHAEKIASAPAAEVVSLEDYLLAQKQHEAVEVIEMASPVPELAIDEVPELQSVRSVPAQQPQPEIRAFVEPQIAAAPAATVEPAPAIAAPAVEMPPAERRAGDRAAVVEETIQDEIDSELFEIFSAEAQEGLPLLNRELRAWQENPGNQAHPQALMRVLHTLKGSARMAGALRVGQGAHEMETQIEAAVAASSLPANLFEQLAMRADRLQLLFDVASGHAPESALRKPEDDVETPAEPPVQAAAVAAEPVQVKPVQAVQAPAEGRALVGVGPANVAAARANVPAKPAQAPALVRVRSDILDRLVNQAGEVAIARTKVESEVEGIRGALGELTENVSRLRGQLREIEIQAESQMASRLDFAKEHTEDFDPLEFDRFTRLQELTRLMAESVNDVATVQQNLVKSLGEADRDLGTQARLTRDLTQDLMRVRMVPFDSVADRLYRVVRQASRDSGKRVNLDIRGGQVEMDRGVLERMVAPFEHLLRNSVAHGVESAEQRAQRGKGDVGQLNIDVRQEGNEIRITFNDDGNGLDFARIRQRGVERGLLAADANPADNELTELIFAPGFTTATELTALAGRGVGMDVVRAESASLGGRISVTSQAGKGSQFTIFLPLTLAVTQVVLVKVGEHTVALPASLVAEVQQLKAQALAAAYNDGQVLSRGQRVPMHYLALLLALEDATAMAQRYSPVVVMAQGEERTAVHVDEVIGTREVIVKNIGPQLARVLGIAGATVLGSGEVVLIINPIPLAQRFGRQETSAPGAAMVGGAVAELVESPSKPASEPAQGLQTLPVVMVVDDSLTVRKVTQRLLVREGYQVVLCKDGVDALRQLQDVTPDVMLVDIEMPRMDGFDLTRNVRGDARYANTPIIMITSRTADKHRNMAMELGVNQFLGKPYQDEELLGHIRSYVQHKLMAQSA